MRHLPLILALLIAGSPATAQRFATPTERTISFGEEIKLELADLPAGARVEVVAERAVPGWPKSMLYRSEASFAAPSGGTLDLAKATPVSGSYKEADPTGLFWSMRRTEEPATGQADEVRITARVNGGAPLQQIVRLKDDFPQVTERNAPFPGAVLYTVPSGAPKPVVIVLGGSNGGSGMGREWGPRLAAKGYAVLGLPYHITEWTPEADLKGKLPGTFVNIPIDRLEEVRDWLRKQPDVDASRIGLWGNSKGGEFVIAAASKYPWLKAVAAIVPSDVIWEGFGKGVADGQTSSFSWRGKPLPFVPYIGMTEATARAGRGFVRFRTPHDQGRWANPDRVPAARIEIEKYKGALLVAGGEHDQTWASGAMSQAIAERRAEAGLKTTLLLFDDAGHGLLGDSLYPVTDAGWAGTPIGNARAQRKVWAETVRLFDEALKPGRNAR